MARVLVLGGSSYVAQFVLQRHLTAAQSESNDGSDRERFVMACTLRGEPESCPLPTGFVSGAPHATSPPASSSQVHVYWRVDLANMTGVRESIRHFRPDVVVNCVAMSSPALCEKEPERAKVINEDFVYDGANPPTLGYKESDAGSEASTSSPCLTVYDASKLAFDSFLLAQQHDNLGGVILRIANVIGPQSPLFAHQAPKFMEWLHQQLFGDSCSETNTRSLRLWSDEVRSFIYVRDLARILFALMGSDAVSPRTPLRFLLLNVGSVDALSRVDLAERYFGACQRVDSEQVLRAAIAPTSRASVDLGYNPPLNARLDTSLLRQQLPSLVLTPTNKVMEEICPLLGETEKIAGSVFVRAKSVAYYSQQTWIQNMTIRDNILFGAVFDDVKYQRVLDACGLLPDLAQFPGGDATEIGEKGVNLSGGQKARVSLARACYSDAELFILDSPLAAVDAVVQSEIFSKCICGLLQHKTIVLVTHSPDIIASEAANYKILVDDGELKGERKDPVKARSLYATNVSPRKLKEAIENETSKVSDDAKADAGRLVNDEERAEGRVSKDVFLKYFKSVGGLKMCVILLIVQTLWQGFQIGSDLWLSHWTGQKLGVETVAAGHFKMDEAIRMKLLGSANANPTTSPTREGTLQSKEHMKEVVDFADKDFPTKYAHFVTRTASLIVPAEVAFLELSVHHEYMLEESIDHIGCIKEKNIHPCMRITMLAFSGK